MALGNALFNCEVADMLARIAAATVVGGIVFFVAGFVIYGLVLDPMLMLTNMNEFAGLIRETPA